MKKETKTSSQAAELRRRAEQRLRERNTKQAPPRRTCVSKKVPFLRRSDGHGFAPPAGSSARSLSLSANTFASFSTLGRMTNWQYGCRPFSA